MPNKKGQTMLVNGCYVSKFTVFPKNWNEPGADASLEWRINYRFYDPVFKSHPTLKGGKQCKVQGMNDYTSLEDKRRITKDLLDLEKEMLIQKGWNPITKSYMIEQDDINDEYVISPDTLFIPAITEVYKRLSVAGSTITDIISVIKGLEDAAISLKWTGKKIKDIKRRHIIKCLDTCATINPNFSINRRNKYRSYLIMLFKELVAVEAIEHNPVNDVPIKRGHIKQKRQILTEQERALIDAHLKKNNYRFWIFTNIFYYSGSRETELLQVKCKDVDLAGQTYWVTIRKGKEIVREPKTIQTLALPFWLLAIDGAKQDDYLFSKNLLPGPASIRADQITRRWKTWVKDNGEKTYYCYRDKKWRTHEAKGLGIDKDFYSLKHLNSDNIDAEFMDKLKEGLKLAAAQNSHKGTAMVENHYAVNHAKRKHDILKDMGKPFSATAGEC